MSEAEYGEFSKLVLGSPLRCHAFNSFIRRPELKVVGENPTLPALEEYLDQCLPRCRKLGASVIVWGSAGSRQVPDGFSRERANDQIATFLHMAGERAGPHGLIIAIEPLRQKESNILNTGSEALAMVRRVKHPRVKMIIDYYHLREENEDPRIVEEARRDIVHLHFANPHGRVWPRNLAEDDHYNAFFAALKKTGYSGGLSIEGKGTFEADGNASREFFRKALA
jgi:sugar phosphate isomerase/epimerase